MTMYHGNFSVPKNVRAMTRKVLGGTTLRNEIYQILFNEKINEELVVISTLSSLVGIVAKTPTNAGDVCAIRFSVTSKHNDEWENHTHNGKSCAPAFLHWVVDGSCTIHNWKGSRTFVAGDVFSINPNAQHWSSNESWCNTICATVAAKLLSEKR